MNTFITPSEPTFSATNLCLAVLLCAAVVMLPDLALASSDAGKIGQVLCQVASFFTGQVGKGIATLAIIVVGVGALMGKVSWGMAIIVAIGVAVIFGAPALVASLGAGGGC